MRRVRIAVAVAIGLSSLLAASRVIMIRPSGVFTSRTVFINRSRSPWSTFAYLWGRPLGLPLVPFTPRPWLSRDTLLRLATALLP